MQWNSTYIDEVMGGLVQIIDHVPTIPVPYRLYNIGNHSPVNLGDFIEILEDCLGKKTEKVFLPMQPGDVPGNYADVADLMVDVGFAPTTPLKVGLEHFVNWYKEFYG